MSSRISGISMTWENTPLNLATFPVNFDDMLMIENKIIEEKIRWQFFFPPQWVMMADIVRNYMFFKKCDIYF